MDKKKLDKIVDEFLDAAIQTIETATKLSREEALELIEERLKIIRIEEKVDSMHKGITEELNAIAFSHGREHAAEELDRLIDIAGTVSKLRPLRQADDLPTINS